MEMGQNRTLHLLIDFIEFATKILCGASLRVMATFFLSKVLRKSPSLHDSMGVGGTNVDSSPMDDVTG